MWVSTTCQRIVVVFLVYPLTTKVHWRLSSADVFFMKMNRLFINIDEILDKNEVDDIIDVHGVVVMRESKIEMKQEDINLSDATGNIKLTLWEDHIDYVQEQIEQRLDSMIPCQKEFSNKTTRLMRESLKRYF